MITKNIEIMRMLIFLQKLLVYSDYHAFHVLYMGQKMHLRFIFGNPPIFFTKTVMLCQ